jgi:predicted transposase/invertase (TIGR01784 family)
LDFILFDDADDDPDFQVERIYLMRERTKLRYSKKLNMIFIELPKFKKTLEELETNADRWLYCLKNLSVLEQKPLAVQGKIFERLFKAAEIKKLTEKEMETYNKSVLEYEDVKSAVDYAKEEFFAKGISQGISQGIIEGKREIAKNLLNLRIPIPDIAQATGLTPEEIIEL